MPIAIVYHEYGPPEVLKPIEVPLPQPGPSEVRVRVMAAGVNPVDAKQRSGAFAAFMPATFPARLGNEYAGFVDALGPDVTSLRNGEAVFGSTAAQAYAEYIVVPASDAIPRPDSVSWAVAAGLPAVAQNASTCLDRLAVGPSDIVLIHAAAGGVGTIAVQLATLRGAIVIGTASRRNHDYLRSLGAIPVEYGPGLADRVRHLAPQGITAALDLVGGDAIAVSLDLVEDRQRIGTLVDVRAAQQHGIHRLGGRDSNALRTIVQQIADGSVVLPIQNTYPLLEAAAAHLEVESGHVRGKVVLMVASPSPASGE